ncbi:type III pantothenate kinase [Rhodocaloribacter sp.]
MWLTLDIGNSSAKGGLFEGPRLARTFRLPLTRLDPAEAWDAALRAELGGVRVERAGIASVVPTVTEMVQRVVAHETGASVLVVRPALRLPFTLAYETPHTLGIDRLAAAAAAWTRFGRGADGPRSVVALDAGTAVTYDVVDRAGVFLGGPIGAGPVLIHRCLNTGTAQLPEVPLDLPEEVIGRSTREALQSGIMYGFLDGVEGMLARIRARLGHRPVVVATGGWGPCLHEHVAAVDHVAPHLVLEGVRVLMTLNPA